MNMKRKILIPISIIVTALTAITFVFSSIRFSGYTSVLFDEMIKVSADGVKIYISECESTSRDAAVSASENPDVIEAVQNRDSEAIIRTITSMGLSGVDFFTVTDENGIVLARTHSPDTLGDSVLGQENVRHALNNTVYTCVEAGTVVKASVRTGAPVYDPDGAIIGVISTGVRFDTNQTLDYLKNHYRADFTVYLGDVRIATTITSNGERILGTLLDPDIAAVITEGKKEFFAYADIFGEMYKTYYMPLFDSDGSVYAIIAAGLPITNLLSERTTLFRSHMIIGAIGLVLSLLTMSFVVTRMSNRVKRLVHIVSEVTKGNINIQTDTKKITTDEIGALTRDIYSLIGVLQSTTKDLSSLTGDLTIRGDTEYNIDTSKYSGSYKEIVEGIKTLAQSISMMRKTMAAMDYLDTMVSVIDFDYNLLYVNQIMADTYGVDTGSCIGKKCYKAIRGLDEPCSVCQMPRLLPYKESYPSIDYDNQYDEVSDSYIGGRAAIIKWVDGTHAFLNSIKDETSKIQYQKQLREIAVSAEAASVAKSSFLANMSHEIRTPMNSIIGFSELAMDETTSQKSRDYLELIIENSKWLLQIINNILDLSKVESGKMELETTHFNLFELIDRCKALALPIATEKSIDLHFFAEASIDKMIYGDPTRLRQVLENLISNAVKFTDHGGVEMSVTIEKETEHNITLRFEVIDSGIGLTPDQIEKIHEPFVQADASTTRKYGGSGLGLPIAKRIIELMGGKLEFISEPGVGTTAGFSLTFKTADAPNAVQDLIGFHDVEKPMFKGDILVCEDSPMNQRVIIDHLKRVGLDIEIVDNGQEGIDKVRERVHCGKKPFDLILMDIHMPVMDGLEAAPKIIELGTGTPVVAMTANIMADDREMYNSLGMTDCIGKPFTSQELWQCLLRHMRPVDSQDGQHSDNDELLNQLKREFVTSNKTVFHEIMNAIGAGDITLAHRLVHTLKSNAGYVGKAALQKEASRIETSLKAGKIQAAMEQMGALRLHLSEALDEFAPYMNDVSDQIQPELDISECDVEKAWEVLDKLEPLLKRGNPQCLNLIGDLYNVPGSGEIIRHMKDFYFSAAAKLLAEVKKELQTAAKGA